MARTRLILVVTAWLTALVTLGSVAAHAHQAPNSEAYVDIDDRQVTLEVAIPAAEYSYASGHPATDDPAARKVAARYLRETISARTMGAGASAIPWRTRVEHLDFVDSAGGRDLIATLSLTPADPADLRAVTLDWRAVIGAVPDHFVLVMLRRDPASKLGDEPVVIGTLRSGADALPITRGPAQSWMPFANAVRLGGEHILGGIDHLAFLLALLLPLPLVARGGGWLDTRKSRSTLRAMVILISGFTLGHSITLIAASLGGLSLPSALVETLIAVSVLIAAIHAIRPLFPRREALFATAFGLVHGLGFAGFLSETDLSMARNIVTLVGFNIGIELVQLAIALMIVPALVVLAYSRIYPALRIALALFCGAVACVWVGDRYFGLEEGFITLFESAVEAAMVAAFVAVLALGAITLWRRLFLPKPLLA